MKNYLVLSRNNNGYDMPQYRKKRAGPDILTVSELKQILNRYPDDAVVLIETLEDDHVLQALRPCDFREVFASR